MVCLIYFNLLFAMVHSTVEHDQNTVLEDRNTVGGSQRVASLPMPLLQCYDIMPLPQQRRQ